MMVPFARALAALSLFLFTCAGGCASSNPSDPQADGGSADTADPLLAQLDFDDGSQTQSARPGLTTLLLTADQSGVQGVRVTSVYDQGGASLDFQVTAQSSPLAAGTFTCGPGVSMRLAAPPALPFTGPDSDGRCTITFTQLGSRLGERVAGSFSAVLRSAGGAMKILSDGSFSLPIGPPGS